MQSHSHSHNHSHSEPNNYNKAFVIGILLNVSYIVIEILYGIISDSLALLADAGHNLSDVLGLIVAWIASYLVLRKPTSKRTYGFKKSSILAAFLNSLILLVAVGGIIWEAIGRLTDPHKVDESTMIIVASIGVIINTFTAFLFMGGKDKDLNIKGAFLHMAADAAISLGVVATGILIHYTNIMWIDPVISISIAIIIFVGTWRLLKESTNLVMDAVPESIDQNEVKLFLMSYDEVIDVHDLHIWAMSTTETALTAHLVLSIAQINDKLTDSIADELQHRFGIDHATIQFETHENEKNCRMDCC